MRSHRPILLSVILAALAAGGCSRESAETPAAPETNASGSPVARPVQREEAVADGAGARTVKAESEDYSFEYVYPAAAAAIPDLRRWLDADLAKQRADLAADAAEQQADAKRNGYPYRALGHWTEWKVVTDLPGWLSLSGGISTYEGGAHPNHAFDTILWDKQANKRRDPLDLFASKAALDTAIRKDFCRALDRQRAAKRGGDGKLGGGVGEFDACIDPVENTVILGSATGKAFDRIGVLVAPYNAGPYAEGAYEVTLPVTQAVLAAVKPEFRTSFAVSR